MSERKKTAHREILHLRRRKKKAQQTYRRLSPLLCVVFFLIISFFLYFACSCYCFTCVWSWFFSFSFVRILCEVARKSFHFNSSSFMEFTITCMCIYTENTRKLSPKLQTIYHYALVIALSGLMLTLGKKEKIDTHAHLTQWNMKDMP